MLSYSCASLCLTLMIGTEQQSVSIRTGTAKSPTYQNTNECDTPPSVAPNIPLHCSARLITAPTGSLVAGQSCFFHSLSLNTPARKIYNILAFAHP